MSGVVMSYGLGVDSTAILLRWLTEPWTRDFELRDLTLVSAITGDEWAHTREHVEAYVLPLMRKHDLRFVQVARSQRYVREGEGVAVLSDSRQPYRLHDEGGYRLSDEMLEAGTIPQSGGARLCSVHAKGDVLDPTIARLTGGRPYRHVMGFEANEQRRADKDALYNTSLRTGEYPLIQWGWDRQKCIDFLLGTLGVVWQKSACIYCPFSLNNTVSRVRQFDLYREHPSAGAAALFMEHVALALNPAQGLVGGRRLADLIAAEPGMEDVLAAFERKLDHTPHAIYEVRRILRARANDPSKLANAARSVRKLSMGHRTECLAGLRALPGRVVIDGHTRYYVRERAVTFPTTEHFFVVAPAVVLDKADDNFERWWHAAISENQEISA